MSDQLNLFGQLDLFGAPVAAPGPRRGDVADRDDDEDDHTEHDECGHDARINDLEDHP